MLECGKAARPIEEAIVDTEAVVTPAAPTNAAVVWETLEQNGSSDFLLAAAAGLVTKAIETAIAAMFNILRIAIYRPCFLPDCPDTPFVEESRMSRWTSKFARFSTVMVWGELAPCHNDDSYCSNLIGESLYLWSQDLPIAATGCCS